MAATALAVALAWLLPGVAMAHPLGNFSVNRLDVVRVSSDRVDVRYVLDLAEIPTFQERGTALPDLLAAKQAEALRGLQLRVDGAVVPLRPSESPGRIARLPGQGGLRTTRVELLFSAPASGARSVVLRDVSFPGRVGWRGMIALPGEGTRTRSDLPATEPTSRLRRYPTALLDSPADQRTLTLAVEPGDGVVEAPAAVGGGTETTTTDRSQDGFAGLFDDAAAGEGTLLLLLVAAFGWGALHAVSPGHGKAMVAAYLVGARGTARHAVILGATVTVTHTIGVFALGVVTLALSQYLLPEDLYPWLNLTAGLLVMLVGASVLRARLRGIPEGHHHAHDDPGAAGADGAVASVRSVADGEARRAGSTANGVDTAVPAIHGQRPAAAHFPAVATVMSLGSRGDGHTHGNGGAGDHAHTQAHGDDHAHAHAPGDQHAHDHSHGDLRAHDHAHADDHAHDHSHAQTHGGPHAHGDAHAHGGDHAQEHDHAHRQTHDHSHDHGHHHHHAPTSLSPRALLAAGASAGLIPCPSALVVLLGAIAQQEIALGLLLIIVFSLGLATTLTAVGLSVVSARGLSRRWRPTRRTARLAAAAPAISAGVIVLVGVVLTLRALPGLA